MGSHIITLHEGYVAFVLASRSDQPMDFRENENTKEIQQAYLGASDVPLSDPVTLQSTRCNLSVLRTVLPLYLRLLFSSRRLFRTECFEIRAPARSQKPIVTPCPPFSTLPSKAYQSQSQPSLSQHDSFAKSTCTFC
jgi:hypothetical protein